MPYIEVRTSAVLDAADKEILRTELTAVVSEEMHKDAGYVMVGIADGYELALGNTVLAPGAMVAVQHMGQRDKAAYAAIVRRVSALLGEQLGISGASIYITFQCVNDWGFEGQLL